MGAPSPPSPLVPPPRPWQLESPSGQRPNIVPYLVGGGRVLGLVLIFVGTLVGILGSSTPGGCYTTPSSCASSLALAANLIIASKVLWALGLFGLAAASGLRLQNGLMPSTAAWSESGEQPRNPRILANLLVLIVSIILMAVILLTLNILPVFPFAAFP